MSKELAERLLAGESLPVDQMLEASESFIDLCIEQRKEIEELKEEVSYLREIITGVTRTQALSSGG